MKRISTILVMGMAVAAIGVLGFAVTNEGEAEGAMVRPASWHPEVSATSPLQDAEYVGARDGCRRCHIREYRSWEGTPHATAIETLEGEDATKAECLKCHTTGFGEPTGFTSMEETEHLANVQCEACHGPGSVYRDKDIMEDREASIAAGMVLPDEQTCRSCHNEESPTFDGFNYEEALEAGVHDIDR